LQRGHGVTSRTSPLRALNPEIGDAASAPKTTAMRVAQVTAGTRRYTRRLAIDHVLDVRQNVAEKTEWRCSRGAVHRTDTTKRISSLQRQPLPRSVSQYFERRLRFGTGQDTSVEQRSSRVQRVWKQYFDENCFIGTRTRDHVEFDRVLEWFPLHMSGRGTPIVTVYQLVDDSIRLARARNHGSENDELMFVEVPATGWATDNQVPIYSRLF
jgi:hypothetical protein